MSEKTFRPPEEAAPVAFLAHWTHEGTLDDYAASSFADRTLTKLKVNARRAILGIRIDA